MKFRDYLEAYCKISDDGITLKAALTLLQTAIGTDAVRIIFPDKKAEANLSAYFRRERNLKRSIAKEILEAFSSTNENRTNLQESLCELCFCNEERIARTKETFGKYCPELLKLETKRDLKKQGTQLLLKLFVTMLRQAANGSRKRDEDHAQQSETEQNNAPVSSQQTTDSTSIGDAQNKSIIMVSATTTDDSLAPKAGQSQNFADDNHCVMLDKYTFDEKEKEAIINICGHVNQALHDIVRITNHIDAKRPELTDTFRSSNLQQLHESLLYEIAQLKLMLEMRYSALVNLCTDLTALIDGKKQLHPSMEKLSEIAHKLIAEEDKYKITSAEGFSYAALSVCASDFRKHYERLKHDWGMQ